MFGACKLCARNKLPSLRNLGADNRKEKPNSMSNPEPNLTVPLLLVHAADLAAELRAADQVSAQDQRELKVLCDDLEKAEAKIRRLSMVRRETLMEVASLAAKSWSLRQFKKDLAVLIDAESI